MPGPAFAILASMNGGLTTRDFLSRAERRALRAKSGWRGAWLLLHCWGVIAAAVALFALVPHVLTFILAVAVIGGRQLGLAILMHDAAHGLLFERRSLNEWAGKWACGWPIGASMTTYRTYHMKHHRFTQQANDPDLWLSAPFPVTRWSMVRKALRDLLGWTFIRLRLGLLLAVLKNKELSGRQKTQAVLGGLLPTLAANAAIFLAFWATVGGIYYLLFWLLPWMTTHMLFFRIRNIAEHAVVPDNDNPLRNTRTTRAGPLARAFVAPYWVNYHIEHHLFVFVPCYRLKAAHHALRKRHGEMEIEPGYLSLLKRVTGPHPA